MRRTKPGDTIGRRYRLLELLGKGGMGTVHRAKDRLGVVALKRLAVEHYDDEPDSLRGHIPVPAPVSVAPISLAPISAPPISAPPLSVEAPTVAQIIDDPRLPTRGVALSSTIWQAPQAT